MANYKHSIERLIQAKLGNRPNEQQTQYIQSNPTFFSLLSKLNTSKSTDAYTGNGRQQNLSPDLNFLLKQSMDKAEDINDNETIVQLLPDIVRASQIYITKILSPRYLTKPEVRYGIPSGIFPQAVSVQIIEKVKELIYANTKLDDRLYNMLYEICFTKGAYCVALIPEASLDALIHQPTLNTESVSLKHKPLKRKGYFAHPEEDLRTESYGHYRESSVVPVKFNPVVTHQFNKEETGYLRASLGNNIGTDISEDGRWNIRLSHDNNQKVDSFVDITDDPTYLRNAYTDQFKRNQEGELSMGLESMSDYNVGDTDKDLIEKFFKNMDEQSNKISEVSGMLRLNADEQNTRANLTEPLEVIYPVESICPIFRPGSPSDHLGYIVLHDENGYPISNTKKINYYRDLNRGGFNSNQSMASSLIQSGKRMFQDYNVSWDEERQIDTLSKINGDIIIREILSRLRNGINGKELEIGDTSDINRIFFYRALQGLRTRVLYIPKSIMTYMAFNYDALGNGRSLLDNMKVLLSLRIQYMMAQIRTGINNSKQNKVITLNVDEHDPDPKATIQMATDLALKTNGGSSVLFGTSDIRTIEDAIHASSIRFNIESDNEAIPKMSQDVAYESSNIPVPDADVGEQLGRYSLLGIGLSPETIDASYSPDFMYEAATNNFLNELVTYQQQERFVPFLKKYVTDYLRYSPKAIQMIRETILSNIDSILDYQIEVSGKEVNKDSINDDTKKVIVDELTKRLIKQLDVYLPQPDISNDKLKMDQLVDYEAKLELLLNNLLDVDSMTPDIVGEQAANMVDPYRKALKMQLLRDKISEEGLDADGVYSRILSLNNGENQTFVLNQEMRDINLKLVKAMGEFFKYSGNIAKSADAVFKDNDISVGENTGSYGSSDTDDYGGSDNDFGGDGDFNDDFGNDDFNEDKPSGEEEVTEVEEEVQEGNSDTSTNTNQGNGNEDIDGPAD